MFVWTVIFSKSDKIEIWIEILPLLISVYLTWWPKTSIKNCSLFRQFMIPTSGNVVRSVVDCSCLGVLNPSSRCIWRRRRHFLLAALHTWIYSNLLLLKSAVEKRRKVCSNLILQKREQRLMWQTKKEERGGFPGSIGGENVTGV